MRGGNKVEAINDRTVVWRTEHIDRGGPWGPPSAYGWQSLDIDTLWNTIMPRLKEIERKKWKELIGVGKGGIIHPLPTHKACVKARNRLSATKKDDWDNLFSIRFSSGERMWGRKVEEVFFILWWDPEHKVYPTGR